MLPYFNAGGNIHYAKAAPLYLQQMLDVPNRVCPVEYRKITEQGYFTIRRSHEFWSGIWTDMVIEQDLMRPMKLQVTGRGDSRSRHVRACCNVHAYVQWSVSSEQHVELRRSKMDSVVARVARPFRHEQ